MRNGDVTKFVIGVVLAATIILSAKQHTNPYNKLNNGAFVFGKTPKAISIDITAPEGFVLINDNTAISENKPSTAIPNGWHLEGNSRLVKNPEGLVDASFIPKAGYHLEQYDYDNYLFYVIPDGYHNEDGYLIPDGWHLEGTTIKKDIVEVGFTMARKLK